MPSTVPIIELANITLRPFRLDDIDPLQQVLSVEGVLQYFPRTDPPDRERAERFVRAQIEHWEKYEYGWWVLTLPTDYRFAGWSGMQYLPDTNEIEIGYLLAKPLWGQGLTTQAAVAAQKWAFENIDLKELVAIVKPGNNASIRVAEKLGMKLTCRTVYFGMDAYRYAITREEFELWNSHDTGI